MHQIAGSRIVSDSIDIRNHIGHAGVEVTRWHAENRPIGGPYVSIVGGLGDEKTISGEELAETIARESRGEVSAAVIRGGHPINPIGAAYGVFHSRNERSKNTRGGLLGVVEEWKADSVIGAGHSQGGISITDAIHWIIFNTDADVELPAIGLFQMDTPGAEETYIPEKPIPVELGHLLLNCLPDAAALFIRRPQRVLSMLRSAVQHPPSPYELAYLISQAKYLHEGVDISPQKAKIQEVLGHEAVTGASHLGDIVPGAKSPSANNLVFEGGHIRFMVEPEKVAKHLIEQALKVLKLRRQQHRARASALTQLAALKTA